MVFVPDVGRADAGSAPRGFFLDRTEVTVRAYRECVLAGRCVQATRVVLTPDVADRIWGKPTPDASEPTQTPEQLAKAWGKRCNEVRSELDHPINCVNFASAEDYCRWKSRRLPTSSEWTAAAAGAGARQYPWGSRAPDCSSACYGRNGSCVSRSPEVATCPAGAVATDRSPDGALDLAGNVSEWVSDEVAAATPDQPALRLVRGGSFSDEVDKLVTNTSEGLPPVTAYVTIGFRCALDAPDGYVRPAGPSGP